MSQDREIFARKKYFVFPSKIGTFDILKDKDNFLLFYLLIFFFFFFSVPQSYYATSSGTVVVSKEMSRGHYT